MGISENDYQKVWNSTLQIIKDSNTYDEAIYNTYIKPTRLFRINDDVALISVPNNPVPSFPEAWISGVLLSRKRPEAITHCKSS